MIDRNKKIEDILSDYYNTIGKFNNVSNLIVAKSYEINSTDDDETKKIKEGQQREILVDLGRIAEMAFKYLIKIRRMDLFPKEPYLDTVDVTGATVRGFKDKETLKAAVIREIGNKVHASQTDIDVILNVTGIGPSSHNFNYLYLIIDKLMADIRNKFNEVTSLNIKSQIAYKVLKEEDSSEREYIAFPNTALKTAEEHNKEKKQVIDLINKRNNLISESGDIFTRLRYYANNPFDKNFDIEEVYKLARDIIFFIELVHMNNENLNFNSEASFSHYILKNNPNLTRFTKEEIEKIYSLNKVKDNPSHLLDCIYFSRGLTIDEIIDIVNCDEVNEDDYTSILTNSLTLEKILYFRSIGIYDYHEMAYELRRKLGANSKLISIMSNDNYSLDEYKALRERLNVSEYPKIFLLLDHMSIKSIDELKKYPDLLRFFINEFYLNVNNVSYEYKDEFFKTLLSADEIRENPNAWYGLDMDQLRVYFSVSNMLLKDPKNIGMINQGLNYIDIIIDNIKENIECFKNNQKLLCVLPLMLDYEDNKHILDLLIKNGLDITDLRGFDSTIFCLPTKLVDVIETIFQAFDVPLIVNNNVNSEIFEILNMIKVNMKSDAIIKGRRIPFNRLIVKSESKNEVIDELIYDDYRRNFEFSPEFKKSIKEFEETIKELNLEELTKYLERSRAKVTDTVQEDPKLK